MALAFGLDIQEQVSRAKDLTFKGKDLTFKAENLTFKPKDLTFKPKDLTFKDKDLTFKAKDLTFKTKGLIFKTKDLTSRPRTWAPGRNFMCSQCRSKSKKYREVGWVLGRDSARSSDFFWIYMFGSSWNSRGRCGRVLPPHLQSVLEGALLHSFVYFWILTYLTYALFLPVEHSPQTTCLHPSSSVLCCHFHLPPAVFVSCCPQVFWIFLFENLHFD